jgi:hypothetical protein
MLAIAMQSGVKATHFIDRVQAAAAARLEQLLQDAALAMHTLSATASALSSQPALAPSSSSAAAAADAAAAASAAAARASSPAAVPIISITEQMRQVSVTNATRLSHKWSFFLSLSAP